MWKKAVTKNQAKLLIKLADFVAECEQLYDIKIVYGNVIKIKHLKRLRKKLYALKDAEHNLKFKYKNITADAGYESEENYLFLEANNQIAFIKPAYLLYSTNTIITFHSCQSLNLCNIALE